ncbi:MAG: methyltransferase domain-containing protein [archaeon]|nr:MAG: methyltransferase domain-containing protein [archaeon]
MNVEQYFDKYAKEHTKQNRWQYYWYRWIVNTMCKEASVKKGYNVLDLGTGGGIIPIKISKKIGSVGSVIGADISKNMLKECRKFLKKLGIKNVVLKKSRIESLNFPSESFDVVFSSLSIDHVKDKLKFSKKVKKWLKPKGRFIISSGFRPKEKYKKLVARLQKNNPRKSKLFENSLKSIYKNASRGYLNEHPEEFNVGPFELKSILEKAGFVKVKIIPAYHPTFGVIKAEKSE